LLECSVSGGIVCSHGECDWHFCNNDKWWPPC